MTDDTRKSRYSWRSALPVFATLLLSACQSGGVTGSGSLDGSTGRLANDQTASRPALSAQVSGERVGNAPIRIALLVPQSASGPAGIAGREIALAAKLAMQDFSRGPI